MQKPVFYDPSGKRKKASLIGLIVLVCIGVALFVALLASILYVPVPKGLDLHMEYPKPQASKMTANHANPRRRPIVVRAGHSTVQQTLAGFYLPGDDASMMSLQKHVNDLDMVIPALAYVNGPDNRFVYLADNQFKYVLQNAQHKPAQLIMVQNLQPGGDPQRPAGWQGPNTAKLVANPAARAKLIGQIANMLAAEKAQGVVFDFEVMPDNALNNYLTFIREARAYLSVRGYQVTMTAPVDTETWNLKAFAGAADKLFLMIYDQHSAVDEPGPIASQSWFEERLAWALKRVPAAKAIICIGNYAYDWHPVDGKMQGEPQSVADAWRNVRESSTSIQFDPVSGNPYFLYDENNIHHQVWMLDAVTAWNQMLAIDATDATGIALWRLGSEDSAIWRGFHHFETNDLPDLNKLTAIGDNIAVGNGEVVNIESTPHDGSRVVTFDKDRVAQNEVYQSFPTPFIVRRTGYQPGKIALTFDDGPDGRWTPEILKILEREHVPATFFVIGEKAMAHPNLLNRMIADGDLIGNHSYSHPDMSKVQDWQIRFELNTTQRIVEAYTGRSMRLLRNPLFGDAEPTTSDELHPALIAQQLGYTNVGLHVDSEDWQKPGVPKIISNVMDGVQQGMTSEASDHCRDEPDECRSGSIVLLHDSGGVRTETITALPTIIHQLKAQGFQFVTVGDLIGMTPEQVMPTLSGAELAEVRFDVGIFMALAWLAEALKWLFIVAIVLGITRALVLSALAIYAEYSGHMDPPEKTDEVDPEAFVASTFVSVIIPAYNEARVIEASVRRVLQSTGVELEIIVVDDGSKDETSPIVANAFKRDKRVHLITQVNAGKAVAVNNGINAAKGEIIIALDADTQFEPETIARLVRWFVRPEIGAVAGNAKVGNRFNWVTRWQGVEYVTAQNLERSALAMFGAMMVVPGAVGAWRRTALKEVGDYPHNTLAEDQDLTIAIQRRGWQVAYDQEAVAWTEAPESFGALMKQRFRWAFGTLQCLWKHQRIFKTRKPRGLALIGLPQAWLFQIGFSVISPIIDFALVVNIIATVVRVQQHGWAANDTDIGRMLIYWLAFLTIDAICGAIAYWLEPREKSYPVFWLLSQRFVYRQIMYYVVLKALYSAVHGLRVGWGKLERSGRIDAPSVPHMPEIEREVEDSEAPPRTPAAE
ncbi:glycosyltransferase [Asticcacaulis solisilvae]|uniref:glycosyltransferase n=1 Tax=Asticcacaulis solisilvae TaxID=1217274 RepID=UPI003FD83D2B